MYKVVQKKQHRCTLSIFVEKVGLQSCPKLQEVLGSTPSATSEKNNDCLNRLLLNISNTKYSHRCLVGDFNFKDINWTSWSTFHNDDSKEQTFIETIRDCFFHQHNLENSRRRGNDQPSLIDLIFTDESMQVSDVHHQAPLGKSDHNVIPFKFNCYLDCSNPKEKLLYVEIHQVNVGKSA